VNARLLAALLLGALPAGLAAQEEDTTKSKFEVYGFAMADIGYNSDQIDPDWFDVLRPTKLPAFANEFPPSGNAFFSVRQSRFGVKSELPTDLGSPFKTLFEFELFGVGVDAGQTTIRLRHAYGELGHFGAGQTWSPFMDIDVFPSSVEYWGPSGMAFFRNIQVRWMPVQGDSRVTFALERPGASADGGIYADRIELTDVVPRFPLPDISAEFRQAGDWGYVELAGIARYIKWEDQGAEALDLSGDAVGWGVNLSSNLKLGSKNLVRLSALYGEGIQNYMNDAPADVGLEANPEGGTIAPVKGAAIPVLGLVAFFEHTWTEKFASAIGYSMVDIDNTPLQSPSEFKRGHYALGNIQYTPMTNVLTVAEFTWGRRENFADGFEVDSYRMQFSFKYNFSKTF
jgi:hypothetical protein